MLALGLASLVLSDLLPSDLRVPTADPSSGFANIESHVALRVLHVASLGLFTIAAIGFTSKPERTGDDLMRWLGAGSALAAWARVNYVVSPSLIRPTSTPGTS